jgi:hypothetical protein
MLEIEQATMNTEAKNRLDAMRVQLGLMPGSAETNGAPDAVEAGPEATS